MAEDTNFGLGSAPASPPSLAHCSIKASSAHFIFSILSSSLEQRRIFLTHFVVILYLIVKNIYLPSPATLLCLPKFFRPCRATIRKVATCNLRWRLALPEDASELCSMVEERDGEGEGRKRGGSVRGGTVRVSFVRTD